MLFIYYLLNFISPFHFYFPFHISTKNLSHFFLFFLSTFHLVPHPPFFPLLFLCVLFKYYLSEVPIIFFSLAFTPLFYFFYHILNHNSHNFFFYLFSHHFLPFLSYLNFSWWYFFSTFHFTPFSLLHIHKKICIIYHFHTSYLAHPFFPPYFQVRRSFGTPARRTSGNRPSTLVGVIVFGGNICVLR